MAAFLVANRVRQDGATLFIDPGFPNQKIQVTALGQTWDSFDVYEHRGEALRSILEENSPLVFLLPCSTPTQIIRHGFVLMSKN